MSTTPLKKKDFKSDQDVRWCPGCGDYAILNSVQAALADMGKTKENTVFISGIGCSSRFPYYMDTYGFHSIHGRAPGIATGVKLANPDLDVWVITGDGDALSIGGNHLIHLLRRRVNIKILLFNNRIYGLTKGQYSPTSLQGHKTKSSPHGSLDTPFSPISLALGAKASFIARTVDIMGPHLKGVLKAAAEHEGSAFVEIYQNCNIFNDGAFDHIVDRGLRDERMVDLRDGQKLIFGKERDKGIVMDGFTPRVVQLSDVDESEIMTWDETANPAQAFIMSSMSETEMPTPIGIFRDIKRESFDKAVVRQNSAALESKGAGTLEELLHSGDVWTVK
jgi:2-oxoglutarate ferredoxin oxidoreductase subunit beta